MKIKYRLWGQSPARETPRAEFIIEEPAPPGVGALLCFPPQGALRLHQRRVCFRVSDVYIHYRDLNEMRNDMGLFQQCDGAIEAEVDAVQEGF